MLAMDDEYYMQMALAQARRAAELGEVPIGAVVVYQPIDPGTRRALAQPRVIAQACNLRETTQDPAGHAEFLAMKAASAKLGVWRLTDCTVYVTLEPCVMCAGLMHQARVSRCVYGAPDPKAGALGTLYQLNADERLNHTYPVTGGVLGRECGQVLSDFFAAKREARKQAKRQAAEAVAAEAALAELSPAEPALAPAQATPAEPALAQPDQIPAQLDPALGQAAPAHPTLVQAEPTEEDPTETEQ